MKRERLLSSGYYLACLASCLLGAAATAHGATYYVDFASGADTNAGTSKSAPWKHAPGMNGFGASYVHAAGDRFIFKGGVAWDSTVFNWSISDSGSAGNVDYYGVDQIWFSGGGWSQPILDGGGTVAASGIANVNVTGSYVTIDNLKIQNLGQAYTFNGGRAVAFNNNHDITIENCTLAPQARIGILISDSVADATLFNFTVTGNDISTVSWGIAVAPSANNAVMSNVVIASNAIHDFTTQMCGGAHGDGIIMYRGNTGGTSGNHISSAYVYANRFYGDFHTDSTKASCVNNSTPPSSVCSSGNPCGMNSFVYVQNAENTATYLYNNSAAYTNVLGYNGSPIIMGGLISLGADAGFSNSFYLYNNSFRADSNVAHGLSFSNLTSTIFENNVMVGTQFPLFPIDLISCTGFSADYNDYYGSSTVAAFPAGCGGFQNWARYHTTNGKESHSLNANPLFVSSSKLNLQPGSPAINAATNLHSVFMTDAAGSPRPASGAWNMGAYQFQQGPNPPSSLQATVK
jgi:hypothetical protein